MVRESDVDFGCDRRTLLASVSTLGVSALAGCSSDSGRSDGSDTGGGSPTPEADRLTITDNDVDQRGSVTISTLTIENAGEEEANPTVSVRFGIGPDGLYGEYSDEQRATIPAGETAGVTLELYDADELSEVAFEEVRNGFVTITYAIDGVEKSHQELGEKSAKYLSFKVLYGGSWHGSLGTERGQRSISGQGESHLPVDNSASIVSGNAQKRDSGSGTLTVQILVDGAVVNEQSTTAEYGVAQVSENV